MDLRSLRIPVEIERVMELEGALSSKPGNEQIVVYAHVSKPVRDRGEYKRYAILASFPQNGMTNIGEIDPATRQFQNFQPDVVVLYKRADNRVICEMNLLASELYRLKTIDDVLAIPGITMIHQNTPQLTS